MNGEGFYTFSILVRNLSITVGVDAWLSRIAFYV